MIYKVKARFDFGKADDFLRKLQDGTIEGQQPDGPEIVNSMNRAIIESDGYVSWTEMCFCSTPLKHERATVYDTFFSDFKIQPISEHQSLEGVSFVKKLGQDS